MSKIEIRSRWGGEPLWSGEYDRIRDAVAAAVAARAVLRGAVLTDADLTDAVLRGAVLTDADLTDADLRGAVLTDADLTDADLTGAVLTDAVLTDAVLRGAVLRGAVLTDADLTDADLRGAVLTDADLTDADLTDAVLTDAVLRGAVLRGAVLRGAVLTDADLTDADLRDVREDFIKVLESAPLEVATLREALIAGQVNGSTYEGECACLVGTIANARGCSFRELKGLTPDSSRPAERWFLAIRPGMPADHPVVALTISWIDNWLASLPAVAQ